jgi:hypothetical protein
MKFVNLEMLDGSLVDSILRNVLNPGASYPNNIQNMLNNGHL